VNVTPRLSYPSETVLASIVEEAGWAPESVCTGMKMKKMKKLLAHSGDLTPNRLSCSKWCTTLSQGPKRNNLVLSCKVRTKDSSCSANREIVITQRRMIISHRRFGTT